MVSQLTVHLSKCITGIHACMGACTGDYILLVKVSRSVMDYIIRNCETVGTQYNSNSSI